MAKQFFIFFSTLKERASYSSGSTSIHLRSWIGISVLDCGPEDDVPDDVAFGLNLATSLSALALSTVSRLR